MHTPSDLTCMATDRAHHCTNQNNLHELFSSSTPLGKIILCPDHFERSKGIRFVVISQECLNCSHSYIGAVQERRAYSRGDFSDDVDPSIWGTKAECHSECDFEQADPDNSVTLVENVKDIPEDEKEDAANMEELRAELQANRQGAEGETCDKKKITVYNVGILFIDPEEQEEQEREEKQERQEREEKQERQEREEKQERQEREEEQEQEREEERAICAKRKRLP
jgi:flagellar biosynthesis GTPase FlhF